MSAVRLYFLAMLGKLDPWNLNNTIAQKGPEHLQQGLIDQHKWEKSHRAPLQMNSYKQLTAAERGRIGFTQEGVSLLVIQYLEVSPRSKHMRGNTEQTRQVMFIYLFIHTRM